MNFYPEEKIALFIDGSNLYSTARSLNFDIDYKKLYQVFADEARLVRAFYYTALVEDQEYSPLRPLIDWLDYNGYTMVTKPAKEYTDGNGRRKVKGNMDIELAVDMMELSDKIDHAVLFSGDGDFRSLIGAVQRRGVRVTVISSIRVQPSMIADELRRQADHFVDISSLKNRIARSGPPVEKTRRQEEPGDDVYEDEDDLDAEFLNDEDAYEEEYASD
ncbi:LabA-like NYN domain-containing protein [Fodinicurvata sediminis]|uniref:LabA-like NYN domain-containing protein n=1 Tax=Fodinicurvata sediminis TaxID=1121832 RepID=UPI0003B2F1BB|nr:NYN domain-containing protein [Fodinicurvata sediminis]